MRSWRSSAQAIPFYERPGGIRVSLFEDASDADRFVEVVEYADAAAFDADQLRVESDAEMRGWLGRWRELLQGPPEVEVYRDVSDAGASRMRCRTCVEGAVNGHCPAHGFDLRRGFSGACP
jgi:quinol monooxygenase YgiN